MNKCMKIYFKLALIGLLTLFTYQYAYADSLEGRWEHDGQPTSVRAGYNLHLSFCNEQGDCAEGVYRGRNTVFVPRWNVVGDINRNKTVISWSNGSRWIRYRDHREDFSIHIGRASIGGRWLHEGRRTSIDMHDDRHFGLINERGEFSRGYIDRNGDLVLPDANIVGQLRRHGRIIEWSNGTTWYRP
jgi:hypothetical protein